MTNENRKIDVVNNIQAHLRAKLNEFYIFFWPSPSLLCCVLRCVQQYFLRVFVGSCPLGSVIEDVSLSLLVARCDSVSRSRKLLRRAAPGRWTRVVPLLLALQPGAPIISNALPTPETAASTRNALYGSCWWYESGIIIVQKQTACCTNNYESVGAIVGFVVVDAKRLYLANPTAWARTKRARLDTLPSANGFRRYSCTAYLKCDVCCSSGCVIYVDASLFPGDE